MIVEWSWVGGLESSCGGVVQLSQVDGGVKLSEIVRIESMDLTLL